MPNTTCDTQNCNADALSQGLCERHYNIWFDAQHCESPSHAEEITSYGCCDRCGAFASDLTGKSGHTYTLNK